MQLNTSAQAQVLWLPKEEVPTADSFTLDQAEASLNPNPETWQYLEDALLYACCVIRDHDKVAWIRSEGVILGPEDIKEACGRLAAPRSA